MVKTKEEKIGTKYGHLTVIEDLGMTIKESTSTRGHYVRCICDCGNETIVKLPYLKNGSIKSCGCYKNKISSDRWKKHNEYYIFENIVFVKYSNCDEYFICDLEDWEMLKDRCWRKNYMGYAIDGKNNRFHRLVTHCPEGLVPDHIFQVSNGVCDNRKSNLEVKTQKENTRNRRVTDHNKSGVIGVFWDRARGKWIAYICDIYLGAFNNKSDAIEARKRAEKEYWGKD